MNCIYNCNCRACNPKSEAQAMREQTDIILIPKLESEMLKARNRGEYKIFVPRFSDAVTSYFVRRSFNVEHIAEFSLISWL